ncbi:STAS domain-containing protein [Kineococcus gypseus]|uniref:STAS domain-containing protein n=1 Tax=Kineococcus gypseus TaxID=1637102 RepID=UPI003D7C876F
MAALRVLDRAGATGAGAGDRPEDGTTVLVLDDDAAQAPGRGVGALRRELGEALDGGCSTLVVDVSGVDHLSSAVVALLLRAKRRCRARGGRVVLRGPSRGAVEVLHRTGLAPLFDVEPAGR